jgi:hypothetical protein
MDDGFETWARSEIGRLRTEADQMERVLAQFLAARGPSAPIHDRRLQVGAATVAHAREAAPCQPTSSAKRTSKNEPIFAAFERAGPRGMSMDDVERVAQEAGLNTNRNALRALCWNGKKEKRLISLAAGRYAIAQKNEAADAPLGAGSAASAREAHDQHGEGRAGGGI